MAERNGSYKPFPGAVSNPKITFRIPLDGHELIERTIALSLDTIGHRKHRGHGILCMAVSHLDTIERVLLMSIHRPKSRKRLAELRSLRADLLAIIEDGKRIVRAPYSPDAIAASDVPTGPTAQPGYRAAEPGDALPRSVYAPQ